MSKQSLLWPAVILLAAACDSRLETEPFGDHDIDRFAADVDQQTPLDAWFSVGYYNHHGAVTYHRVSEQPTTDTELRVEALPCAAGRSVGYAYRIGIAAPDVTIEGMSCYTSRRGHSWCERRRNNGRCNPGTGFDTFVAHVDRSPVGALSITFAGSFRAETADTRDRLRADAGIERDAEPVVSDARRRDAEAVGSDTAPVLRRRDTGLLLVDAARPDVGQTDAGRRPDFPVGRDVGAPGPVSNDAGPEPDFGGGAGLIEADLQVSRRQCFVPCVIHADARQTRFGHWPRWRNLVDLNYEWDFGDRHAGSWQTGATRHSANVDTGFYTGHVYTRPGRYEIRLRVTDGLHAAERRETITVVAADLQWPGQQTVCVSSSGEFSGCPQGAAQVVTSDFDAAFSDADKCNADSESRRCLFRRGDRFTASRTLIPLSGSAHMTGAFGNGDKPIVELSGGIALFQARRGPNATPYILAELDVRGSGTNGQRFFEIQGRPAQQLLILNTTLSRFDHDAIQLYAGTEAHVPGSQDRPMPHHIAIVGCYNRGRRIVFSSTEHFLFLGNDSQNTEEVSHVVRIGWMHGAAVSHNTLGHACGDNNLVLKIHNHKAGDRGNTACTREFVVADNLIDSCRINDLDIEIGPNSDRGEECVEHFVVERNHFRMDVNEIAGHRALVVSGQGATVRNNIFDLSGETHTGLVYGVTIRRKHPSQENYVMPADIRVFNNSCYAADRPREAACISFSDDTARRTWITNNVLYDATENRQAVLIDGSAPETRFCERGQCNLQTRKGPFVVARPRQFLDFLPGPPLLDAGDPVPATRLNFGGVGQWPDGDGTAQRDIGALQR